MGNSWDGAIWHVRSAIGELNIVTTLPCQLLLISNISPQNGEAMDTNVHIDQVDMDQLRSALPI